MRRWGHRGDGKEGRLSPRPDLDPLSPDLRLINTQAIFAKGTGMIILGGGVVKHHIANANLMVSGGDASAHCADVLCARPMPCAAETA